MGATRYLIPALLIGSGLLTGCAADDAAVDNHAPESADWGDEKAYPELGGKYAQELTALNGTCAWNATTGAMTITTTAAADQTIIIGARSDNVMTVNGALCASTSTITKTTLKSISVVGGTGADVVILDFINGSFAPGLAAGAGIKMSLSTGTDAVRIRATTGADTITIGTPVVSATVLLGTVGIGTGVDALRDIEVLGAESFAVSLGAGADVFSANGGAAVGAASTALAGTLGVAVNGGAGNDTITGGAGADSLSGSDGDDSITGGLGVDTLNGDLDNDTLYMGTVTDGGDTINCHGGTDVVSYAGRTIAVTATVAGAAASGEGGATEGDTIDTLCEGLTGGSANDTLTGDTGANVITGGAGNDSLVGGTGADSVSGGLGDDTIDEGAVTSGADTINGDGGTDTVTYGSRTVAVAVTLDGAATSGQASETDTVASTIENVVGGAGADTLTGSALDNVMTGGDGTDTLIGGDGNDTFVEAATQALSDGDSYDGGLGTDTVDYSARSVAGVTVTIGAGSANDGQTSGSEGDDVQSTVENVTGSATIANAITGDAQANELVGGAGVDTLTGGAGNDILDGGSGGADALDCGADDDIAYGGATPVLTACEL